MLPEEGSRIRGARERGEERPQFPRKVFNAGCAAEFAIYHLLTRLEKTNGQRVQALRPDGSRLNIPATLLRPTWYESYRDTRYADARRLEAQRRDQDVPVSFDVEAIRQDYWIVPFLEEECFTPRGLRVSSFDRPLEMSLSVINWRLGCIDLRQHKLFMSSMMAMKDALDALSRVPCELPATLQRYVESDFEGRNSTFVKTIAPLDGCSVIAPTEWLEELVGANGRRSEALQGEVSGNSMYDLLLNLIVAEEVIKKPILRQRVVTQYGISGREFDRIWDDIAEERPDLELNKPGPKSRRRNERF
ncbi:hypothetical protein [Neorhizobium petrolearium]